MASKTFDPKALLERHGWKFGSGLGKDEGGIKEAIKVELKMDRAGMGYDASEKYSFQWWDHVFNTAANSIEVVSDENGVSIKKTSTVDVSTKKQSKRKQTKAKTYGCFVKTATLTNNGIELKDSDSDSSSDSDAGVISKMTDEELFKACGGMTGHKGARHGLNLRGKLLRIQQHDEQFLRSQKTLNGSTSNGNSAATVLENMKTKTEAGQASSIKVEKLPTPSDGQDKMNAVSLSGQVKSVRKQKKKQKRDSEESKDETKENTDDVDFTPSTNEMITKGKNKKKRKRDDLDAGEVEIKNTEDEEMTCPKLRKKKRNRECDDNLSVPIGVSTDKEIVFFDEPETELKKLKKRTKHKESGHGDNKSLVDNEQSVDQSEQIIGNSEKKSKKLKKKKEQEKEEKEQQESIEKEPLCNKNQTEATEVDGCKEQSKKKEKKNRDKEAMTNHVNQPVEDASMQKKKCKESKKSGKRKEASMNEIMDLTHECNAKESKLQNKKYKKSKIKEHYRKDNIINQTDELAAHESKSQRMKCKNAKKHADIKVLPVPESTDDKKVSKTASKKSKKCKQKQEDEEINLKENGNNFHTVCDLEACTSSNAGLENHTLQPKAKRQKKNSCVDLVGKTNDCEINNTSH